MISLNKMRELANEDNKKLSKEAIKEIKKKLNEEVKKILQGAVRRADISGRKVIKAEDVYD
jgi:histone H3/H4